MIARNWPTGTSLFFEFYRIPNHSALCVNRRTHTLKTNIDMCDFFKSWVRISTWFKTTCVTFLTVPVSPFKTVPMSTLKVDMVPRFCKKERGWLEPTDPRSGPGDLVSSATAIWCRLKQKVDWHSSFLFLCRIKKVTHKSRPFFRVFTVQISMIWCILSIRKMLMPLF